MRVKLLAITAIISGVLVLLGWFTLPVRVAMLAVLAALAWRSFKRRAPSFKQSFRSACSPDALAGAGLRLLACSSAALASVLLLWHSGTTDPIRSPWSVVPVPFFFLYALLAMMMVVSTARSSFLASCLLLLTASLVAILVYPLGFGFDHFIHAAAEHIIATTGALSPPPFFYSGHYGLTILLADLLPGVGVDLADRLLTPLLTVAFLVPLAYRSLRSVLPDHVARLGLSALLIVPFLPLAVSTPQATANVFALATMFLLVGMRYPTHTFSPLPDGRGSDSSREASAEWERGWVTPLTAALAALLSQPMTGIIAIAVVAMAFAWQRGWRIVATTITALGVVGIPLAFALAGRIIPNLDLRVVLDPLPALQRLSSALRDTFAITAMDFATADALAVVRVLLPILWVGLAITGALARNVTMFPRSLKHGDTSPSVSSVHSFQPVLTLILAPLIVLVAAALVAATVTIPTQLGEEQSQFPLRLVSLAALLATPLAAIGLGTLLFNVFSPSLGRGSDLSREVRLVPRSLARPAEPWRSWGEVGGAKWETGWGGSWYQPLAAALTLGTLATFTLLLAYPRDDAQARSGLWSVSADDIAAVHAIASDAGDVPYVVLANQMLGAAAIRELGFKPTHRIDTRHSTLDTRHSEILAFPLPAGGPIARQFWNYVSQPPLSPVSTIVKTGDSRAPIDREPVDAAMDLVDARRAYVVLHDYWRNAERLAAATAAIADAEVGQFSHLRIFRLTRGP